VKNVLQSTNYLSYHGHTLLYSLVSVFQGFFHSLKLRLAIFFLKKYDNEHEEEHTEGKRIGINVVLSEKKNFLKNATHASIQKKPNKK
jgi:hypothetical protein